MKMVEEIEWKSCYQQEPIEEDIYFKFVCFYQAMTELYDRGLTDERSPYDKTEAYFYGFSREYNKKWSDWYAWRLYNCIAEYIRVNVDSYFDVKRWNKQKQKRYSAQGWIDMFEYFKKQKDEIILDMIENIWEYDRRNRRKTNNQKKQIVIKNPFL